MSAPTTTNFATSHVYGRARVITAGGDLIVNASDVNVNAPEVTVNATSVTVNATTVTVHVHGEFVPSWGLRDTDALRS